MNEGADAGDDEEHHAGERIDERDDRRLEVPRDDPREERAREAAAVPHVRQHRARREKRARDGGHRDPVSPPSDAIAEEDVAERARERQSGDQPDGGHRVMLARGRSGCQASARPAAWYHSVLVPKRSRSKAWLIVVLLVLLAAIGSVSYLGWRQSVRGVVSVTTPPRFVGHKTAFVFTLEAARGNVARVEIRIVQGGSSSVVAKQEGTFGQRVEVPFVLESATLGLREGSASLEVWARDDFWRPLRPHERAIASYPVTVDLTPPKIELLGATRYLSQGGSGLVAFRVTGASRTTVSAGKLVEPSFAWGPPERGTRVALIALPWDLPPGTALTITAEDEAGNVASRGIPSELRPRRFPRDSIELKDAFLEAKVPELLPQRQPSQPLVDSFLIINRDLRRQAEETKRQELGRTGASGLALGDHLHFEVLVHGVSVTPIEWWDARWIRDHITKPLLDAGLSEIGSGEEPGGRAPARNAQRPTP